MVVKNKKKMRINIRFFVPKQVNSTEYIFPKKSVYNRTQCLHNNV